MRYVLFDIDGTLTAGGNGGNSGPLALNLAFEDLYGLPDGFTSIAMAGKTDPIIAREAFALHGIALTQAEVDRLRARYLHHLDALYLAAKAKQDALPGAEATLRVLAERSDVAIGLLTGNWREGARMKLASAGLDGWFDGGGVLPGPPEFGRLGAFGEDAPTREGLVPIAWRRYRELLGREIAVEDTVIIGDTPRDILCARENRVRSIGVATGPYAIDELRASCADEVLADLTDTERVVQLLTGDGRT